MITVSTVVNASKTQMLCITYEILLDKLEYISENINELKSNENNNKIKVEETINESINIIKMLAGDLNFEFDIANQLFKLYVYVQGLLIKSKTKESMEEAYTIINKLYMSYKEISQGEEGGAPSISNAEKVYEGLTYGENKMGKTYAQDFNRGYKV